MNCPDFDILMLMLDGELEEDKLKEVSEHLKSCGRCRNLVDSQKTLEASWRDSFVIPESNLFRTIEREIFNRINRRSRWKSFIPVAAGIIAVLIGVKLIMNNQPSLDRVMGVSRDIRLEYRADPGRSADEFNVEAPAEFLPESGCAEGSEVLTEDAEEATSTELNYADVAVDESVQPQCSIEEEDTGEFLRGGIGFIHETDRQIVVGGTGVGAGSGGGGGEDIFEYGEEREEIVVAGEIALEQENEECFAGQQLDGIDDITLSMDADTTGLETVTTVVSAPEEMIETCLSTQSDTCYSRYHEVSDLTNKFQMQKAYIELAFDAAGEPDSSTALLLDSLFVGWNDYIPFVLRDTVIVIPLMDLYELFSNGSADSLETIE